MDFKNDFINKDKELYTLIVSKALAEVVITGIDVARRGPSKNLLLVKPLLITGVGLYETLMVATNRSVLDSIKGQGESSASNMDKKFFNLMWTMFPVTFADWINIHLNMYVSGFNPPKIPIALVVSPNTQIDGWIQNPIAFAGIPPLDNRSFEAQPFWLKTTKVGVSGLGSLGLWAGIVATNIMHAKNM